MDRLKKPGVAGYPSHDTVPYLAVVLGGQIVLQIDEAQEVFGKGPLVAHIGFTSSSDGAGHVSGHFVVYQSWMAPERARKRHIDSSDAGRLTDERKTPRLVPAGGLAAERPVGGAVGAPSAGVAADVRVDGGVTGAVHEGAAQGGAAADGGAAEGPAKGAFGTRSAEAEAGAHMGADERRASEATVGSMFDGLAELAGGFAARPQLVDKVVDMDDIVQATAAFYAMAKVHLQDLDAQQIAVVLLLTYKLRLVDMSMKEYVHLIWAIEGDRWLRAHNGTLYLYADGAWRPFVGIFPVSVISRVRRVLLNTEGFLRMLPASTPRTEEGILSAVQNAVARASGGIGGVIAAAELAVLRGGTAGSDDVEQPGWGPFLATTMAKVRSTTTNLLCARKCVPFLVEWCDTPRVQTEGFACRDACFLFSKDGVGLTRTPKAPDSNVYFYLPQSMHDAVQASHVTRLRRFLCTTFHDNAPALECHFAAFALVLRGFNIDRAFWTLGQGGVGQSLLSHLVATVFGDNHCFLDMNMYYTDDELRKQGELLCGKTVVTGQEMPNCSREMREDLYKKHVSADPVSCRLPYAVVTKQVQLEGLKRFEMNQPPRFHATGEAAFNSIMRRSLVVELKGTFVTPGELDEMYPDGGAEAAGCFVKDPTLKDFVTSQGAVAAFLRVLEGFLMTKSAADCREIIEGYVVGGGDGGLTRTVMRAACGLSLDGPPQPPSRASAAFAGVHAAPQTPAPAVPRAAPGCPSPAAPGTPAPAPATPRTPTGEMPIPPQQPSTPRRSSLAQPASPAPRAVPVAPVPRLGLWSSMLERQQLDLQKRHVELVQFCLDRALDFINKSAAVRVAGEVWPTLSRREVGDIFDRLVSQGYWKQLPKRYNQAQPCIPLVRTRCPLVEAFPQWRKLDASLPEVLDARRAREFVLQEDRACNDTVMIAFFEASVKAPDGVSTRGRLCKELEAVAREWQDHLDNARGHVQTMQALRAFVATWARGGRPTDSPSQRSSSVTIHTDYHPADVPHPADRSLGRLYTKGLSFQNLSRRAREPCRGEELHDWDMCNAMVGLTVQLVAKLPMDIALPDAALPAWNRYASNPLSVRDLLARTFGAEAKAVALKVANGGGIPQCTDPEALQFLTQLSKESRLLRWWACGLVPDLVDYAASQPRKHHWPENFAFHYVWTTAENQCLLALVEWLRTSECRHLSLHYDGVMVDAARCERQGAFGAEAAQAIADGTGFQVELVKKTDLTLLDRLRAKGVRQADITDPTGALSALVKAGQSVPLAVAHVTGQYHATYQAKTRASPNRKRTYADWFVVLDAVLPSGGKCWAPVWGLRIPARGSFLVHSEGEGRPGCVGLCVEDGGGLRMFDGKSVWVIGADAAREAYAESSDRSTVVTFAPEVAVERTTAPRFNLANLRAL